MNAPAAKSGDVASTVAEPGFRVRTEQQVDRRGRDRIIDEVQEQRNRSELHRLPKAGEPVIRADPYGWNDRVAVALGLGTSASYKPAARDADVGP